VVPYDKEERQTERKHDDWHVYQETPVASETTQERDADADAVTDADLKRYGAERRDKLEHQEAFECHAGSPGKKRCHLRGWPQETREEHGPVAVFVHELLTVVVQFVEDAPVFERLLHARSVAFADAETGDVAEISAGNAGDEGRPDRKHPRRAQYAAGVKEDFARHEKRERHEHLEIAPREKQRIRIKRDGFEKRQKGAEHGYTKREPPAP
jgi:hypothetical protein